MRAVWPALITVLTGWLPGAALSLDLTPLSDSELESVSGAGIAVALEDFRYMMAPTSYMEQVGIAPAGTAACTGTGSTSSRASA